MTMFDWRPSPGTLPGRSEMLVLRAIVSLRKAGVKRPGLRLIHTFCEARKYPAVDPHRPLGVEDWTPSEGTVRHRLRDLEDRGLITKTATHNRQGQVDKFGYLPSRLADELVRRLPVWAGDLAAGDLT